MTSTPPAYPQQAAPKSSGKKWVLFGCGGCLGLIALGVAGIFAFVIFVLGAIKQSDAYKIAIERVQNSPQVQEALGTPMKENFFSPMGAASTSNGASTADLAITLQGPKGVGVATVKASKAAGGEWEFSMLTVTVPATNSVIDLLQEGTPALPAPQN